MRFIEPDGRIPIVPFILLLAYLTASQPVVALTLDTKGDALKVGQAYADYHSSVISNGIPGGPGSKAISKSLGQAVAKEVLKETKDALSKQVSTEVKKTYQTYIKPPKDPKKDGPYSGKTSGTGTPEDNVRKRDSNHHKNETHGPAELDKSSASSDAIRGREQINIKANGGAKSSGGSSGNAINGISKNNRKYEEYIKAGKKL